MAVETYDVVAADVYPYLPFNTDNIGASSDVTPTDIGTFITQGASLVSGALRNAGVAYTSLDDDQKQMVTEAVIQYAVYQTLAKLGFQGSKAEVARQTYERAIDTLAMAPNRAGVEGGTVESNVNTSNPYPRKFGRNYGW